MKKVIIALISLSIFQTKTGDDHQKKPQYSDRLRLRGVRQPQVEKQSSNPIKKRKNKLSPIKNKSLADLKKLPSSLQLAEEKKPLPPIISPKRLSPKKPKRRSTIAAGVSSAEDINSSVEDGYAALYSGRLRERKSSTALETGNSHESGRKVSFYSTPTRKDSSARASFSPYLIKSARKSSVFNSAGLDSSACASENSYISSKKS